MDYLGFKKALSDKVCISTHQIHAGFSGFNDNNLTRWVKKGLLIKLRNGYYAFPEYLTAPASTIFIANHIYRPSYVSLHLAFVLFRS